jgi:hypothetical protein
MSADRALPEWFDFSSDANDWMATSVQMIWGEQRGHGTMGAVQRLPMELTHVATFSF